MKQNYKRFTFILQIITVLGFGNLKAQSPAISADSVKIISIEKSILNQNLFLENGDTAVVYAKTFIGTRYRYGGNFPKTGFDCSGFVDYVFRKLNIELPRASRNFDTIGISVSPDSCLPGDIVLFSRTLKNKNILTGHVGIVVENCGDSFKFIHATTRKGIMIDDIKKDYYFKRFRGIRRVLKVTETGR